MGPLNPDYLFIDISGNQALITALKRKEASSNIILRAFNLSNDVAGELKVSKESYDAYRTDLIETEHDESYNEALSSVETNTIRLKKEK